MGISNLPWSGGGFRVSTGAGNFTKKFSHELLHGELQNLSDNKNSILKVVKKFERPIRLGAFSRLRQLSAWREIRKLEGSKLTYGDKKDVKNILKHLSERPKEEEEIQKKPNINRAVDPNSLTRGPESRFGTMGREQNSQSNSHGLGVLSRNESPSFMRRDSISRGLATRRSLNSSRTSSLDTANLPKSPKSSFSKINNLLFK
jgi:hypothetical protein